jgi:thiol-disulfide isomerase/thioredoxin
MLKKSLFALIVLLFALSACAPAAPGSSPMKDQSTQVMMEKPTDAMMKTPADTMMEKPTDAMMKTPADTMMEKPTDAMMKTPADTMMEKPAQTMAEKTPPAPEMPGDKMATTPDWFGVSLTDVRTGKNFTLNDFKGKVVLVENLAMWCPSCKQQQIQVKALHTALGMMTKDLVSIGLDIDSKEVASDLKTYTDTNGFDWMYAVAPVNVTRAIGSLYGDQFLNPPSTPILIIDRKGQVHPMPFGIKSADELKKFIEPFLAEPM